MDREREREKTCTEPQPSVYTCLDYNDPAWISVTVTCAAQHRKYMQMEGKGGDDEEEGGSSTSILGGNPLNLWGEWVAYAYGASKKLIINDFSHCSPFWSQSH